MDVALEKLMDEYRRCKAAEAADSLRSKDRVNERGREPAAVRACFLLRSSRKSGWSVYFLKERETRLEIKT